MKNWQKSNSLDLLYVLVFVFLNSCATTQYTSQPYPTRVLAWDPTTDFTTRLPQTIETKGHKVLVVDPRVHSWGAYDNQGSLIKAGIATAGGDWCDDVNRSCRTGVGTFHINSLGGEGCRSHIYPKPKGGGLMPYCMFFHGSESLHGSPDHLLADNNISHGCVRMRIQDAEWVRYNFASIGTKVIVRPYE